LDKPGIYGLFGPNGSGKSTLLKMMSGLLFADKGSIEVLGCKPAKRQPRFLEQVYFVPEEFHLPHIGMAALLKTHAPFYPAFSRDAFQSYAGMFEIPMDLGFASMSLGQKKKAVIAFALATNTPLLMLDEPTNGLDILGRSQFKEIMSRPEHRQRTVIISTHQAHDLQSLIDHVLFVNQGKLDLSIGIQSLRARLDMGVVDDQAAVADPLYMEALGQQWAYIQANRSGEPGSIQLELLYKALSVKREPVLAAIHTALSKEQEAAP
jgi:ABC-2 type transport system ATP-binding protein